MKLKFLATCQAPDYYSFNGSEVTAHFEEEQITYDLSKDTAFESRCIRGFYEKDGEKCLVLCQKVIAGQYPYKMAHWRESDWLEDSEYDSGKCYVIPSGMKDVTDYLVTKGIDVAGTEGWTVIHNSEEGAR